MEYDPETHNPLSEKVASSLKANPHLTINLLASSIGAKVQDVEFVLDEFFVDSDGDIRHVGPGQGGGWVDEETRASMVKPGEPIFIGYRWPDGSLNTDEPFDLENPEHRAAVGIKLVTE